MIDRMLIAIALVILGTGLAPAPAAAEEGGESSGSATAHDETDTADDEESDQEASDESKDPYGYPAPGRYTVAVGLSGGRLAWDSPQGSRSGEWMYGLTGRYVFWRPLFASISVDHSRYAPTAGDLVVANRHVAALAGVGAELWASPFRFSGQLQGGTIVRMLQLDDRAGNAYTESKIRPAWGLKLGIGTGMFGTAAFNLVGGVRGYGPGRLDIHYGLRFEWMFGRHRDGAEQ